MNERVFDNFTEFYALTRPMTEMQREILMRNLSLTERRQLLKARKSEGWDDLLIRNQIDLYLDQIKDEFNEDLILLRIQVLHGHLRKVRKAFWVYINDVFAMYSMRHKWHIFEGIVAKEYKDDWVLLVPQNGAIMSKRKNSLDHGKKVSKYNNGTLSNDGSSKLIVAVTHKNEGQKEALRAISQNKVTFISGAAGTGKTHLSIGWGLQEMLMHDRYERLILTRPVVEAGENLGFLPGTAEEKIAPYMMPIFDILSQYVSEDMIEEMISAKRIIILPIAYMRGRTFSHSYVVMDEAQNCTIQQMHLLLTRMGVNSKMVITGDTEQSDLCYHKVRGDNGLQDALTRLKGIESIEFVELGYESCVRDQIINEIDAKYRVRKFELQKLNDAKKDDENPRREPKTVDFE